MKPTLRELFFQHVAQTSPFPLAFEVTKAEGVYIYDQNNNAFLDAISGIAVGNLGYHHPAIIKAIHEQTDLYLHTMVYGEHIQSPQVRLAQKLSELTQHRFDSVYFVNSGAEAVEGAIKLARRYTGRKQIIACKNAYHGSTTGAFSLNSSEHYQQIYGPFIQEVDFIEFNNINSLDKINNNTAAVFVEPIQGEAGYIPATVDFLYALRERCNKYQCLLVFDEIQSGIGRTGKIFAFEHYQIYPDVLLLAKALGFGLPLGTFMASKHIMQCLAHNPILGHMTTFGGHPLSCAASLAGLNVLTSSNILSTIEEKEQLFKSLLKHPKVKEVRGKGLMIAVQLESFETVENVIRYAFSNNILLDWFLFNNSAIRIAPPLIIENQHIIQICKTIIDFFN